MSLPLTKKDLIRFTPERENAPTYLIGVPSIAGRAAFNRRLDEEGISFINDSDLLDIVRAGVREVVAESQQEEILALIDEFESTKTAELAIQVADIEKQLRRVYPPYTEAVAARSYHMTIMPVIAAKCFLRGIENGVAFKAQSGVVTDECLEQIAAEGDLDSIGWKAVGLFSPNESQIKNSDSPLQSTANPEILTATN